MDTTAGCKQRQFGYDADIRESASVAHIYGQNLVAAESLTAAMGPWAWSPATLKPTADKELAMGLNRFVIHTSVHQPLTDGRTPGLGLGPFGQWFTRNETWAEQAKAWTTYLARSSYLLQQGRFVADIAYFYGEDSNLTALFLTKAPPIPAGYNFDYINADALIHKLKLENGQLTTASGMKYKVLALDPYSRHMSLPVLRKIHELVSQGANVVGARPDDTPSLADDTAEFKKLADQLWGGSSLKGHVYATENLAEVLQQLKVGPDFAYTKPEAATELLFVHRKLAGSDIYYVDNRRDRAEKVNVTFRVAGKAAELWRADTGTREPAAYEIKDGQTTVPLELEPWGTVFVVFRGVSKGSERRLSDAVEHVVATLDGPWQVKFQAGRGAPEHVAMDKLSAWSESGDLGVKYFSGIGTYAKKISVPSEWLGRGTGLWLDLGDVKNLAEVWLNGKQEGIVWKTPYRLKLTGLKVGENELEVRVVNSWVNRMIGDRQPDAKTKYTFTSPQFYKADSPLQSSGLLGPVQIISRSVN